MAASSPPSEQQVRQAAYRLINYRDRSRAELQQRLRKKFPDETMTSLVDSVVNALYETDLINDTRLAARLAEDCFTRRGFGPARVQRELSRRLLPKALWQQAMAPFMEREQLHDSALSVCHRYFKGQAPDRGDQGAQRRLAGYLGRRGVTSDLIHDMIQRIREGRLYDEP